MTNRKIELNICIINDVFNNEQIMPVCDNLLSSVSRQFDLWDVQPGASGPLTLHFPYFDRPPKLLRKNNFYALK